MSINLDILKRDAKINEFQAFAKRKRLFDIDENEAGVIDCELLREAALKTISKEILSDKDEENFDNCTKISLEFKNILRIDFLWMFTNLTSLSLANNLIEKIEKLENLVNLVDLNLSFNRLAKIENLDKLVNIETLNLFGNQINSIENLDHQEKLTVLSIGGNKIHNIDCVKYLRRFKSLKSFTMYETPLDEEYVNSRETVTVLLPQLLFYNNILVTAEERNRGRTLNLEMIEAIEKQDAIEEELKLIKGDKSVREEYLRKAMIHGFQHHEFYEYLIENDPFCKIIRSVGRETIDVFNNFREKLFLLSEKLMKLGEEYLVKRNLKVQKHENMVVKSKQVIDGKMDEIYNDLKTKKEECKKELLKLLQLPQNAQYEDALLIASYKRAKHINYAYKFFVKKTWYKMMDFEMRQFEFNQELNAKYDWKLRNLIEMQKEAFQTVFTDMREAEREFSTALGDSLITVMADYQTQKNDTNYSAELKLLLDQPQQINNAILDSYDQHLLLIDTKEDEILVQLKEWFDGLTSKLSQNEYDRNRKAVYDLNIFLDSQEIFFDKLILPLKQRLNKITKRLYQETGE